MQNNKQVTLTGMVFATSLFVATLPTPAQAIDFGNDASEWARDGECDDPRFHGPGMTSTPLLGADMMRDATDCYKAYQAGRIWVVGTTRNGNRVSINFGNDNSQWARDGECDDPRFAGPGMTNTALLVEDILRDASDCRRQYQAGNLRLR